MSAVPAILVRRKRIINQLRRAGAVSPDKAVTLEEAGIFFPGAFPRVTRQLEDRGILNPVGNGKYWLDTGRLQQEQ